MNLFKALLPMMFLVACGSDDKPNTHTPIPTPVPTPYEPTIYPLQSYYTTQIEGKDIGFSTTKILKDKDDVTLAESTFLTGDKDEQGNLMDVCYAKMSIRYNFANNYYLTIYGAYHSYLDSKDEMCASFNGAYWVKLGDNYSISFDRVD